jgi:hypothetical protein
LRARGTSTTRADRSIAAELGPTDRIEVRWGDPQLTGGGGESEAIEGIMLWDIEPAGDRLRARFTYRGPRRLSTLSFRMDPGLIPRSIGIPGMIGASWGGTDLDPVWTARMDPPIQDGIQIVLDMWRPHAPGPAKDSHAPPAAAGRGEPARRFPLLEPVEVDGYTGLLGVRRPGNWTGRLESVPGSDPLSDESFVKAWGPLPDDMLTLSGTTRVARGDRLVFPTGPAPSRIKVKPTTQLRIESGRIDLQFDAELNELSESLDHLDVAVPRDLAILGVDSEGLTHWSRPEGRRLLLRYDRAFSRSRRRLRISGWIPVLEDPLKVGIQQHRAPTPWLDVARMESVPGLLIVTSHTRVDTVGARGLTLESASPLAGLGLSASDSLFRQSYRVDDPSKLGELLWNSAPPLVKVLIESQLTVHFDSAEWVAVLRYDVLGGALDAIHLKVPTPWAARAQVEVPGNRPRLKADQYGPVTFWTITPERPIWGTQRLVLRSALPSLAGQEVQHPEITPLGRGVADTYLGLVNATGSTLTTAGSSGLDAITYASRFKAEEFGQVPGAEARAFRVERDNWSLRVQVPPTAEKGLVAGQESARVESADLDVTMMPDGTVLGRAVYETQSRTGRFLEAEIPPDSTLIWSTVDANPVAPLRSAEGRWLVPLGEEGPNRVSLFWRQGRLGVDDDSDGGWSLTLPRAGVGRVSTVVTVHHPDEVVIKPPLSGLQLTVPDRVELERADRIGRQITEFLGRMDRSSGRDRERITSLVIAHEMALRGAERSLKWNARRGEGSRRERADRELEVIQATRKALAEGLRASALDQEADAAQAALGVSARVAAPPRVAVPEPATPDRFPALGRPTFLIGLSTGLDEEETKLNGSVERTPSDDEDPERARSILMVGLLVALGLTASARPGPGKMVILILAGVLGLAGGPIVLACGMALAAAGWNSRTDQPRPVAGSTLNRRPPSGGP